MSNRRLVGIVWGLKTPPEGVLRNEQRLGSRVINRSAEQLASHFNAEWIVPGYRISFKRS
jgi:stearoyl-CoA desaturase (delta-9 desaturase)